MSAVSPARLRPAGSKSDPLTGSAGGSAGHFGSQDRLHLPQGELMGLGIEGSHALRWHLYRVVPEASVGHGIQDTDIGAISHHNDLLRLKLSQALLQVGAVEGAKPVLGDDLCSELPQLWDDLRLFRTANTMGRKHLKLGVVGGVGVHDED